ncbi:uncharacterized protein [Periplaneta americana]|uniref:uncharacterized protein n=1 Tax=Periplaneta americana TaxID=6978 RepID=UPI0037E80D12
MTPDNVYSVLLVGPTDVHKSSLLFQCAVHFAEQGSKVLYISSNAPTALPPPVHGVSPHSAAALSNIRFMYLPTWRDLAHQLYSLHQHAHMPGVLIVDSLDHYCSLTEDQARAALVCASLLDAASVCSRQSKKSTVLLTSLHTELKTCPLVDLFFASVVWLIEADADGSVTVSDAAVLPRHKPHTRMVFHARSWDTALVLEKILQLVS